MRSLRTFRQPLTGLAPRASPVDRRWIHGGRPDPEKSPPYRNGRGPGRKPMNVRDISFEYGQPAKAFGLSGPCSGRPSPSCAGAVAAKRASLPTGSFTRCDPRARAVWSGPGSVKTGNLPPSAEVILTFSQKFSSRVSGTPGERASDTVMRTRCQVASCWTRNRCQPRLGRVAAVCEKQDSGWPKACLLFSLWECPSFRASLRQRGTM